MLLVSLKWQGWRWDLGTGTFFLSQHGDGDGDLFRVLGDQCSILMVELLPDAMYVDMDEVDVGPIPIFISATTHPYTYPQPLLSVCNDSVGLLCIRLALWMSRSQHPCPRKLQLQFILAISAGNVDLNTISTTIIAVTVTITAT